MTQILLVALIKKISLRFIGYDSDRYVPVLAIAIGKKAQEAHGSVRLPVDEVREYL